MKRRIGWLAALALLLLACGGPAAPTASPAVTVPLAAKDNVFLGAHLTVPSDVPFGIAFDNQDIVPHNVVIAASGPGRGSEPFTGPATKTLVFSPLAAGSYTFTCAIHPEMHGVIDSVVGTALKRP